MNKVLLSLVLPLSLSNAYTGSCSNRDVPDCKAKAEQVMTGICN
jgi:peroxiredoxin